MQNKPLAYDLVIDALSSPLFVQDYSKYPPAQALAPQDAAELFPVLNMLQQVKQAQGQAQAEIQSHQVDIAKKQLDLGINNMTNTYNSMIALKNSLQDAIIQAKKGYAYVMWMYVAVFYLGIALIITGIVFAGFGKNIMAIAFGTIGLIDIVTYMLFKPALELQSSRSNFSQLTAALINWFTDLMNLNTFLSLKQQYLTYADLESVSKRQGQITKDLLEMIETYSEPGMKSNGVQKAAAT